MKTIIRIEHPQSSKGLFTTSFKSIGLFHFEYMYDLDCGYINSFDCYEQILERHKNFPTPWCDKGIEENMDFSLFCGFKSIQQIQEWIEPEWFNEIIQKGFRIYTYNVTKYIEGEYQIVFDKSFVSSVTDITELFISKDKFSE